MLCYQRRIALYLPQNVTPMQKPLILVTNDDGIFAKGIRVLVEAMCEIGEVIVVAPNTPQSAKGHAITLSEPLRLRKSALFGANVAAYECSGTPVDCVKLAKHVILKERKPDLCVSGINHGSNASINIIYSGTMSAAMEGAVEDIPSIGFSLDDFHSDADFEPCKPFILQIATFLLHNSLKKTKLLNVNFPKLPLHAIKGVKLCRQAEARWIEAFQEGKDPAGRTYYWLTGKFVNLDNGNDTDIQALQAGYVSVVPCGHDLTDYQGLIELKKMQFEAEPLLFSDPNRIEIKG
jgi:5'-nucleotidase